MTMLSVSEFSKKQFCSKLRSNACTIIAAFFRSVNRTHTSNSNVDSAKIPSSNKRVKIATVRLKAGAGEINLLKEVI